MTNKRFIFLGIVFLISLIGTAGLFAQTLTISGTVAADTSINLISEAGYNSLDLTSVGAKTVKIATIEETNNVYAGYDLTISTDNGLVLNPVDVTNTDSVPYTVNYGGSAVSFTGNTYTKTAPAGTKIKSQAFDVEINYTVPADGFFADTYSDTLTFGIVAN